MNRLRPARRLALALVLALLALAGVSACGASDREGPLVVLFSDLGTGDYALPALKGHIYDGYPDARVVDGAVSMPSFDVAAAAYILDLGSRSYPDGTVIVGTTNPGDLKGTRCLAAVGKDGLIYLAPDNGMLTRVARRPGLQEVYHISDQSLFAQPLAKSSPDYVLAASAALVASGTEPGELGQKATDMVTLDLPDARITDGVVTGTIVYIDGFGNCLTNIPTTLAAEAGISRGTAVTASWQGGHTRMQVVGAYGDVPRGDPLVLFEASSSLQLCVNMGSFAEVHGIDTGTVVSIVPGSKASSGQPHVLSAATRDVQAALDRWRIIAALVSTGPST